MQNIEVFGRFLVIFFPEIALVFSDKEFPCRNKPGLVVVGSAELCSAMWFRDLPLDVAIQFILILNYIFAKVDWITFFNCSVFNNSKVQSTLGLETLDKAAALGLETATPLTDPRQYINSNLGFRNLKI